MIIGVSGKAGSGKDTLADYLVKYHGFHKLRFAARIKKISADLTGTSLEDNYNKKSIIPKISYGKTEGWDLGKYQQKIGGSFRKSIVEDIWIRCLKQEISKYKKVVVCDMRFKNEAKELQKMKGCVLIRLERDFKFRKEFLGSRDPEDISETDLDDFEFKHVIENNGTKEEFIEKNECFYLRVEGVSIINEALDRLNSGNM